MHAPKCLTLFIVSLLWAYTIPAFGSDICNWPTGKVRAKSEGNRYSWSLDHRYDTLDFILFYQDQMIVNQQLTGNANTFEIKDIAETPGDYRWQILGYDKKSPEPINTLECTYHLYGKNRFFEKETWLGVSPKFQIGSYETTSDDFKTSFDTYSPSIQATFHFSFLSDFFSNINYESTTLLIRTKSFTQGEVAAQVGWHYYPLEEWLIAPYLNYSLGRFHAVYATSMDTIVSQQFRVEKTGFGVSAMRSLSADFVADFGVLLNTTNVKSAGGTTGINYGIKAGLKSFNFFPWTLGLNLGIEFNKFNNVLDEANQKKLNIDYQTQQISFIGGYIF